MKKIITIVLITGIALTMGCRKRSDIRYKKKASTTQPATENSEPAESSPKAELPVTSLNPREDAMEHAYKLLVHGDIRGPRAVLDLGADTIPVLNRAIASNNINAMLGATKALAKVSAKEGGKLAVEALKHKSPAVRMGALDAISAMKFEDSRPQLYSLLADDDLAVRATTCDTLAALKKPVKRTLDSLFNALGDPEDVVRAACANAFAVLAPVDVWLPRVAQLLLKPKLAARLGALRVMGEWKSDATFDLIRGRLSDTDTAVRAAAIAALAPFANEATYREISTHLKDKALSVRTEAVASLARLPKGLVQKDLYDALKDRDVGIRIDAAAQLVRFPSDPETLIRLHALLRDENSAVRENAAEAMTILADKRSLNPSLERLRVETEEFVRLQLYRALAAADSKAAVPHLIDFMDKAKKREPGVLATLLTEATGQSLGTKADPWRKWYKSQPKAQ